MISNHDRSDPSESYKSDECLETGEKRQILKPLVKSLHAAVEKCLSAGEFIRFEGNHRQEWIQVLRGMVWVTQPGDGIDHILKSGDRLLVHRPGLVLAQGLANSTLRIGR
jgi:hypothetical protein